MWLHVSWWSRFLVPVDLMHQPWDSPSLRPWCTKSQEFPITQPSSTSHNCHGSEKTHPPCFISLFCPFWTENPSENPIPGFDGWNYGEIQLQRWPGRQWWINTDYERKLLYLTATAAAKRYRHQKGLWASEEGDMKEVESFRGIFATQQRKGHIGIMVALHGMGIIKRRTCWTKAWQQLDEVTFFFLKEET